jgi:hypothetical protein
LAGVVDRLCAADPAALADPDTIVALHRQLARLDAAVTQAVGAFDTSRAWAADGARSAGAWIATRCRQPAGVAHHRARLARALPHIPQVRAAWLAGRIDTHHAALLARAHAAAPHAFARDQSLLVGHATDLAHRHLTQTIAYWEQLADPDGPDGPDARALRTHTRRRVHLSRGFEGRWHLDAMLDPLTGAAVADTLGAIETELFAADWAHAKARLGHQPRPADLARTPTQRRADALVEMAARARAAPPGARRPAPLLTVLVDYPTLTGRICQLADGTPIAPAALLPWLTPAWVERVVFDSPDRVRNVGAQRRLFTGATRRAIEVRDQECFHPYCDQPAPQCQIDHIHPYATGGPTTDHNGRPACPHHNRHRHDPP